MPRRTSHVSEKKRLANQRNARKSTGPKTPAGKKRSSQNAITHGLFCQEICVLKEERPLYIELRREFIRNLKPQRLLELAIVDKIIHCQWKLRRLRITESIVYEAELREHLKEEGRSFLEEMASNDEPDYCAMQSMCRLIENDKMEKFTRIEQRMQNVFHRCLKELRAVRADWEKIDALPPSPYEATVDDVKYGLEDDKTFEQLYEHELAQQAEEKLEEEELEEDVEEAPQEQSEPPPVAATPSPQPLTSHEHVGTPLQGEGVQSPPATAPSTALVNLPVNPPAAVKAPNEPTAAPIYVLGKRCATVTGATQLRVMRRY